MYLVEINFIYIYSTGELNWWVKIIIASIIVRVYGNVLWTQFGGDDYICISIN